MERNDPYLIFRLDQRSGEELSPLTLKQLLASREEVAAELARLQAVNPDCVYGALTVTFKDISGMRPTIEKGNNRWEYVWVVFETDGPRQLDSLKDAKEALRIHGLFSSEKEAVKEYDDLRNKHVPVYIQTVRYYPKGRHMIG